ncbi:hypothetical protein BDR07DRAFT_1392207, partial [Suillus spraguei]
LSCTTLPVDNTTTTRRLQPPYFLCSLRWTCNQTLVVLSLWTQFLLPVRPTRVHSGIVLVLPVQQRNIVNIHTSYQAGNYQHKNFAEPIQVLERTPELAVL